jgi:phenylacetate-coenzyme A ligase PaaK-like adenylate-forming protein
MNPLLASYHALPPRVQSLLGTACRALPKSWRFGSRYGQFKELAQAGEQWSPEHLEALEEFKPDLLHASPSAALQLAMPLIRYRTGDYVQLADPKTDGDLEFPWAAAKAVAGRDQEFLL